MNLNEMLLKEQLRLEKIVKEAGTRLKNAPEGTLRLSGCRKSIQYYRCLPGGRKNGEYLPKSREKLIRALAQKSYDEKVVRLAEKRLAQIRDILEDYEDDEFEKLLLAEHPERQKLIRPAEISWEQRLEKWLSEEYTGKAFQKGAPVILTERGERVRSKSEKILADLFFRRGIPYKYECPLYLKGYGTVHPDFTFLSERTGMVTVQTGLRIYCADRTKTYRQEASGPSRSDWNGRMPLLFCRRLNSNPEWRSTGSMRAGWTSRNMKAAPSGRYRPMKKTGFIREIA